MHTHTYISTECREVDDEVKKNSLISQYKWNASHTIKRQIYYEINYTILSQHDFLLNENMEPKRTNFLPLYTENIKPTLKKECIHIK